MSNFKEALAQDFIFLHGDKKYSKEHQFIAYEHSRNETHVIVGYAYRWFSDAKLLFLNMLFLFLIGKIKRNLSLSMIM